MVKIFIIFGFLSGLIDQCAGAVSEILPFAIASGEYREQVQSELEATKICMADSSDIYEIVEKIDAKIGHSDWGWSCSENMSDYFEPSPTVNNIIKFSKEENFNAALKIWRSERDFLRTWSADDIKRDWPTSSFLYYEKVIFLLQENYNITVKNGVGYIGQQGRYFEFSPPLENPGYTVNEVQFTCNQNVSACVAAFFVSDGVLYPTIYRSSYAF